jgi:hypothetical protein
VRKRKAVADVSTRGGFSKAPDELRGIHKRQSHDDVRGRPSALAADDALKRQGTETRFGVRETAEWNGTPANWSRKCSNAECFSTSSTGRRIIRRYRLTSEPLGGRRLPRPMATPKRLYPHGHPGRSGRHAQHGADEHRSLNSRQSPHVDNSSFRRNYSYS